MTDRKDPIHQSYGGSFADYWAQMSNAKLTSYEVGQYIQVGGKRCVVKRVFMDEITVEEAPFEFEKFIEAQGLKGTIYEKHVHSALKSIRDRSDLGNGPPKLDFWTPLLKKVPGPRPFTFMGNCVLAVFGVFAVWMFVLGPPDYLMDKNPAWVKAEKAH